MTNTTAVRTAAGHPTERDPRWAAVESRDKTADGTFYYSVATSGVYCLPSCPARLPNPENVRFHATREEAERAGFRPCKRCLDKGRGSLEGPPTRGKRSETSPAPIASRVQAVEWDGVEQHLDAHGWAILRRLLSTEECRAIAGLYEGGRGFRSHVVMARHGFGRGEYRYFSYPLPELIVNLRTSLYPRLTPIADRWNELMGIDVRYPATHARFIDRCHAAGQTRPTPLLLQYGAGDYNCLHQDLYGEHVFPFQVAFLLSEPGEDFEGGEFVLTEQRPRMQSRVEVVPLRRGDGVIFAVSHRPVHGTRGTYRVNLRHGVSRIRSGRRHTLGVIFHDAA